MPVEVGLGELVTTSVEAYEELAVALATDRARRTNLRESLRQRFPSSPLADAAGFTRALEAAYEEAWRMGPRS